MWKKVEFLYLNHEQVHEMRPPYEEIVALCETCFRDHAAGTAQMPPKIRVTPRDEMYVHAKPGYLPSFDVAGIKWQSNVEENPANGLPNNIGLVVLTNPDNGAPRAVMDCSWITALRTPAAAMAALKHLRPKEARTVSIIGLGLQGRCHFEALLDTGLVPEFETVQIYDLRPRAISAFADFVRERSSIKVMQAENPEAAVRGSDIIISCTQFKKNSDPQIRPDWVKAGSLALPADVGSYWTPQGRDVMDKIFTDDIAQTQSFADYGFFQGQSVRLDAEIGRVVIGEIPGRTSDDERLMCINAGLSLYDIALAQRIYERARERDVGTVLTW
jgi:ornithine cyclodeaminase/alanine dehydrogenase-like protein (mu-crystallin family)